MGERRAAAERLRSAEFEAFTAGAAGRLLHAATLLTGDPADADALLCAALTRTYADWRRMRGEDPYAYTRAELVRRFAHRPWWRRPGGGVLGRLTPQERLVVVLRLYEGVAEEQAAAQLGLPANASGPCACARRAPCAAGRRRRRPRPPQRSRPLPSTVLLTDALFGMSITFPQSQTETLDVGWDIRLSLLPRLFGHV